MSRKSPLMKIFDGDKLVGLELLRDATNPGPNIFETEIVRIFKEY